MIVLHELVRSALEELSDVSYQERVWGGHGGGEMSSFVECVSRLFDDSGLDQALEADQEVYGLPLDDALRALSGVVASIDGLRAPQEVLNDPRMHQARRLAGDILRGLRETGDGLSTPDP